MSPLVAGTMPAKSGMETFGPGPSRRPLIARRTSTANERMSMSNPLMKSTRQ